MPSQKKRRQTSKKSVENAKSSTTVYCICRSMDGERFMIACDRCEEWYHGDCINVTPKQADQIKTFYCHQCRLKEKNLEIEYKPTRGGRGKSRRTASPDADVHNRGEKPLAHKQEKSKRSYNSLSVSGSPDSIMNSVKRDSISPSKEPKSDQLDPECLHFDDYCDFTSSSSPTFNYYSRTPWSCSADSFGDLSQSQPRSTTGNKGRLSSPRTRSCGNCSGCTRPHDCGMCDYCRDRRKFGGPNRMRQKCRLRQCSGCTAQQKQKGPSVHGSSSRRRKQHTINEGFLGPSSPNLHQYTDFEDEPFEVPTDFSPRPCIDHGTPNVFPTHLPDTLADISSKVRRGDRRIPSHPHDLDTLSLRTYPRLSLDGNAVDMLNDDSDEDVMITGLPHCAGPACMSAPIPGGKYCSEGCRTKHTSSRFGIRTPSRLGTQVQDPPIPYNLPYPDHMYCKHHRYVGNSISHNSSLYRTTGQSYDSNVILNESHLSSKMQPSRQNPSLSYSDPLHQTQRFSLHNNSFTGNPTNRLSGLDTSGQQVMCDPTDAAAFIESAMRRTVVPFDEMDLDLPPHPAARLSMSPGFTSFGSLYSGRNPDVLRSSVDLRHGDTADGIGVGLDDSVGADHDGSQLDNQYYYMMAYQGDPPNGHSSRNSFSNHTSAMNRRNTTSSIRLRNMNNRMLLRGSTDTPTVLSSTFTVGRSPSSVMGSMRRADMSAPIITSGNAISPLANVSSIPTVPVSNYLPTPDEFYTINDSDDLEINWPQESIASVNS